MFIFIAKNGLMAFVGALLTYCALLRCLLEIYMCYYHTKMMGRYYNQRDGVPPGLTREQCKEINDSRSFYSLKSKIYSDEDVAWRQITKANIMIVLISPFLVDATLYFAKLIVACVLRTFF